MHKLIRRSYQKTGCKISLQEKIGFVTFLKKNPKINLKTSEITSLSRAATSFNRKNVNDFFFKNLKQVKEKFRFEPKL